MEITKREILFSVVIICVLIILGIAIGTDINNSYHDEIQRYELALKVENDPGLFQYAIRSHVGNVFASGTYSAIEPVSFEEFDGAYLEIEKVKEVYKQHTRTVTKTRTVNGTIQTYTDVKTYWTWDRSWSKTLKAQAIEFLGIEVQCEDISFGDSQYIDTIYETPHVRYKYYIIPESEYGTLFTNTLDGAVTSGQFYTGTGIEETIESLESFNPVVVFWIFWTMIVAGCVFAFYKLENKWIKK